MRAVRYATSICWNALIVAAVVAALFGVGRVVARAQMSHAADQRERELARQQVQATRELAAAVRELARAAGRCK